MTFAATVVDRESLATLESLLEREGAILAAVHVDASALQEVIEAKAAVIEALQKAPVAPNRIDPIARKTLRGLRALNQRNGRIVAIRRSSNQRILDAVAMAGGMNLYGPSGRAARNSR